MIYNRSYSEITRKSSKKDLIGSMIGYLVFSISFGGMGTLFLFIMPSSIFMSLFCTLFILVGVCFIVAFLKKFIKYFVLKANYEFYITVRKTVDRSNGYSVSTETFRRMGHEIGLPDRFADLTKEQNHLLDTGQFIPECDIEDGFERYVRNLRLYDKSSPEYIREKELYDNAIKYNRSNTSMIEENDDPFSKDDCKYNIDKDDPFADYYNKGK